MECQLNFLLIFMHIFINTNIIIINTGNMCIKQKESVIPYLNVFSKIFLLLVALMNFQILKVISKLRASHDGQIQQY